MHEEFNLFDELRDMCKQIEEGFRDLFGGLCDPMNHRGCGGFGSRTPSGAANEAPQNCRSSVHYAQVVPTPACFSMDMQSVPDHIGLFILVGRPLEDFKLTVAEELVTVEVNTPTTLSSTDGDFTAQGIGFDTGSLKIKLPFKVNLTPVSKSYRDGTVRLVLKMAEPVVSTVAF
jgi:hypothetical protein